MKFSEFAKTLEEFYKGEHSQADFTKDLFCNLANDEFKPKIENRSSQAFIQYYQGGRSIKPIAKEIRHDLNIDKFKKYLAQRENNIDAKEKLCSAFKDCAPDIKISNVFDEITNIFVDIINDAYNEPDGRCKKQTVESRESLFSHLNITKEDISELKTLARDASNKIYVLLDTGNEINNKANELGFNIPAIVNPGLYNELDKNYEVLRDFTYDLRRYNSKYPNGLFDRAIEIISQLKAKSFVKYYSPFFNSSSLISELQDIFNKILDELKKL